MRSLHWPVGPSPTFEVAPRRLLKTPDQGYPLPTNKAWQLGAGTSACRLLSSCMWLGQGGWVAGRVLGRRCMGLADGHDKQPGPGLRVLGGGVTAALVQAQPGPAASRVTPNAIQGAGCSKMSSLLAEGVPPWRLGRPVCPSCPFGTGSVLVGGICSGRRIFLRSLHKTLTFCLFLRVLTKSLAHGLQTRKTKKRLLAWPALCSGCFSLLFMDRQSSPLPGATTSRPVLFRGGTGPRGSDTFQPSPTEGKAGSSGRWPLT